VPQPAILASDDVPLQFVAKVGILDFGSVRHVIETLRGAVEFGRNIPCPLLYCDALDSGHDAISRLTAFPYSHRHNFAIIFLDNREILIDVSLIFLYIREIRWREEMTRINRLIAENLQTRADRIYWHVMMTLNILCTILVTCAA
jgi:hypothetical protein